MIKVIKSLLFILACAVMTLCLFFLPDVSGPVSVIFMGVLSCYLGIDVADTIIKSAAMKQGEYKNIHIHKYVISLICLLIMIVVCIDKKETADLTTVMTSLISSVMLVIGILLTGLEGNKIATNIDGENK